MKTSELTGLALDWGVCKAGGGKASTDHQTLCMWLDGHSLGGLFNYSTDWAQGGPIIEREGIDLWCNTPASIAEKHEGWATSWRACYHRCGVGTEPSYGPTPLIAAMRCYVASRLGDEVDIPEELL